MMRIDSSKYVITLFLVLSVVTGIVLTLIFNFEKQKRLREVEVSEVHSIRALNDLAALEFRHIAADLQILGRQHELRKYLQKPSGQVFEDIIIDWSALQEQRGVYDQIRYLEKNGQEKIRLNLVESRSIVVPAESLQNKANRYYFREAMLAGPGQIYVSPLDLNVEKGQVEIPYKPMIRFGLPVLDEGGEKRGVIILNYHAKTFLDRIRESYNSFSFGIVQLVNQDGYWLMHAEGDKEWGFMLGHEARFDVEWPAAWSRCQASERGQYHLDGDLFTFTTVRPFSTIERVNIKGLEGYGWKVIAHVPKQKLAALTAEFRYSMIGVWILLSLIYLAVAIWIGKVVHEKKQLKAAQFRNSQLSSLGEVAAGIAHEINNPIGGVINYSQILLNRQSTSDNDRELLLRIQKEGNRIAAIVSNMLHFAKKDRESQDWVSVREIIETPLGLVSQQFNNDGIRLKTDIPDNLPELFCNALQMEQVVLNLLSNARHALNSPAPSGRSGKMVQIRADERVDSRRKFVEILVEDNGCGISEDHLKKVFVPFFTTKAAGVGTGLGLSLSNEILVRHNARISIDSVEGEFTRVTILFPVAS